MSTATLLNMRPRLTKDDLTDCFSTNAIEPSYGVQARSLTPLQANGSHVLGRHPRVAVRFTANVPLRVQAGCVSLSAGTPALSPHIVDVDLLSSEKQVVRTDAGAVVALVQDSLPTRNWAVVYFPRDDMGSRGACATVLTELPVSMSVAASCPDPTGAKFGMQGRTVPINLGPESLGRRTLPSHRNSLRCQTPGVSARRGHFVSLFYHTYQGAR